MKFKKYKYDYFIFILVASLASGNFGGSLQLVRVLGILLFPKFYSSLKYSSINYLRAPKQFAIFFMIWSAFSFLWTVDIKSGITDYLYFIIHFVLFFEIIVFSKRAKNPFLAISLGWAVALFATSIIAFWELQTGGHLSTSKLEEGFMVNRDGEIVIKRFAAATFYNYNMYELFICYCTPFVIYLNMIAKKFKFTVLYFFLLVIALYIAVINASRGAILSLAIMMAVGLYGLSKERKVNRSAVTFFAILSIVFVFYKKDTILDNLMYRMSVTDMLDGHTRYDVWYRAWDLFVNSYGLGTGIGGLRKGMLTVSEVDDVIASHNLFLEVLLVHGIFVFIMFFACVFKMFKKAYKVKQFNTRIVLLAAFFALPVYSIINSTYLQSPSLYVYFASLYVLIFCSSDGFNYNSSQN